MQPQVVLIVGAVALAAWAGLMWGQSLLRLVETSRPRPAGPTPAAPSADRTEPEFGGDDLPPPVVAQWWRHLQAAGGDTEFTAGCVADGVSLRQAMQRRIEQLDPPAKPKAK